MKSPQQNNLKNTQSEQDKDNNAKKTSLLTFPQKFPIKIFGESNPTFCQSVKSIINAHVAPSHCLDWQENTSNKGNYLAITVTIMAQSQTQLDAIYMDLTANPHVKMAL